MSETRASFGSVSPPFWTGETVCLIGGGPSLKDFDIERLRGRTAVAVNDAARYCPWAKALFSLDKKWISERKEVIRDFAGEKYLAVAEDFDFSDAIPGATYLLRVRSKEGLSDEPGLIFMGGGNSGFGALNLAYLKRASRIVLLGYDYCQVGDHWYENPEWGTTANGALYRHWAEQFWRCLGQLSGTGIEVWNASPISLIEAFPSIDFARLETV